ncbi:MAG: TIGR04282 family arsenosugar biosynthesis glycosyltransferase [Myxococcota bacterium]
MHDTLTVITMAKPPFEGRSKTRLAKSIGQERASVLAYAFLRDSLAQLGHFQRFTQVLATTEEWPQDRFPLPIDLEIWQQGPGDLGERLERMMFKALQRTQTAIALGADTPGLPQKLMLEAVHSLQSNDAVLGPSHDGGFYLIGMRRCPPGVFSELPWSAANTCDATSERLMSYGLTLARSSPWFDIDTAEDLHRLRDLLERGVIEAPDTSAALARLGDDLK